MFPGGDRGDRPGASRGVSPSLSFSLTLPAYLRETTIGFCTLEQSEEASDGSRVWYAGGQRARITPSVPHNDTVQCNTPHISNNEAPCSPGIYLHRPVTARYSVCWVHVKCLNKTMSDSTFSLNSSYFASNVFTFEAVNGVWQSSTGLWNASKYLLAHRVWFRLCTSLAPVPCYYFR